jgi:hypothetical protein
VNEEFDFDFPGAKLGQKTSCHASRPEKLIVVQKNAPNFFYKIIFFHAARLVPIVFEAIKRNVGSWVKQGICQRKKSPFTTPGGR